MADEDAEPELLPLVRATQEGDALAQSALLRLLERKLTQYVTRITHGQDLGPFAVEDIVQDTLMQASLRWEGMELRSKGEFVGWLLKIAQNRLNDLRAYLKAQRRSVDQTRPLDDRELAKLQAPRSGPSAEDAEVLEKIRDILDKMRPDLARAFLLMEVERFSAAKVARMLQRSPSTVRRLRARATAILTGALRPELSP